MPASKKGSSAKLSYDAALEQLVDGGALSKEKVGSHYRYTVADVGKNRLIENLMNDEFAFIANIGAKTANAMLRLIKPGVSTRLRSSDSEKVSSNGHKNGSALKIDSYEIFTKTALETYDRLNQDYNLDNLVPIYRIRRELGDRLPRKKFNEWLLEIQSEDLVQLMGSNLSDITQDQMEDSITIPGAGARFFVKRT
ncbi:MAG: hypothetical protein DCF25_18400 [Leptolyngbya foveolarum]|uniref:Uncharacterized protein n=1 Tax=Leptolyngbya foveolarum TaxID=47253 RepID=A0A2W4TYP0_9CYAN|nr:MAG: hypothetical protein DCF25_18400 [Leptolyngbya foveolarum]